MGKGDIPRAVDKKRYDENFKRIFGEQKISLWEDAPDVSDKEVGTPSGDVPADGHEGDYVYGEIPEFEEGGEG